MAEAATVGTTTVADSRHDDAACDDAACDDAACDDAACDDAAKTPDDTRRRAGGTDTAWWSRLRSRLAGEDGSSPVTAWGAMIMLLLFIFVTVQTTLHLYAVSQASSIALEAASRVARGDETCATVANWIDDHVGHWDGVTGGCTGTPGTTVTIEIVGNSPAPALQGFGLATNKATLDREATMRMETFQ